MEEVYVLPNRLKSAVLGGILLTVAAGMTLTVALAAARPEGLSNPTLLIVSACIGDVLFLSAGIVYLANALKKFQLHADREGITVNCTLIPFGFIPWSAVERLGHAAPQSLSDVASEPELNALVIELRSPGEFKSKLNIFRRALFCIYGKKVKAPLSLCKGKSGEIVQLIASLYENYGTERR